MSLLLQLNWLSAATAPTTTLAIGTDTADYYGLQVFVTGSPTRALVVLQGSIDGTRWQDIIAYRYRAETNGTIIFTSKGPPVKFLRLDLRELSGGTVPTVTASVTGRLF